MRARKHAPQPIEREEYAPGPMRIIYDTLSVRIPLHSVETYADTLRLAGTRVYVRYDTLYKTLYMQQVIPRQVTRTDTLRKVIYLPQFQPGPEVEPWKPPLWLLILISLGLGAAIVALVRFLLRL